MKVMSLAHECVREQTKEK